MGICCQLEVVGEERGRRANGGVCMWIWSLNDPGYDKADGRGKPKAIVWSSCSTCICLPRESRDPGGCCAAGLHHRLGRLAAGKPTSFLPSLSYPFLSSFHKVVLK